MVQSKERFDDSIVMGYQATFQVFMKTVVCEIHRANKSGLFVNNDGLDVGERCWFFKKKKVGGKLILQLGDWDVSSTFRKATRNQGE